MGALAVEQLCKNLALQFSDLTLLRAAFTHSSYRNEHRQEHGQDNERLEFLGDAVLELCVSRFLYRQYPLALEGDLTRMRAALVCEPALVDFAVELGFPKYLRLGKGEEQSGGRKRPSLLADVLEAFIGALFLDQGFLAVDEFLARHLYANMRDTDDKWRKDYKTILQEYVQRENLGELAYETMTERGPAHDREFVVYVKVNCEVVGKGVGRSKKEAEQKAAEQALGVSFNTAD